MDPERWQQIESLYHAVVDLGAAEREVMLAKADPEVRHEVEALIAQDGSPLEVSPWDRERAPPKSMILETGTLLGPYRIEERIGVGGMGEVYRAIDTRLDRIVAIKTCQEQFSARFQTEARAISSLNHTNICSLFDVGPNYLVMEYIAGITLADLIHKGPMAEEEVRRIGLQVAEGIEAAHEKGIVHRDLKPANIKISEDGKVKVLDFGLAKPMNEVQAERSVETTQAGVILGTPTYMSPEQAVGNRADRRSDIWSFGVMLMEMLTGKRPFGGSSIDELRAAIVRGEPDWSAVPGQWVPLLRRCLTKDVRRRLQSIGEARLAIEDGLAAPAALGARRRGC